MTREELIAKWGEEKVNGVLYYPQFIRGTEQEETDRIDSILTELFP